MGDTITDPVTGVSFPKVQHFWHGGPLRCLGAGARVKTVGFLSVKVYAVAMFVDAKSAGAADRQEKEPASEAAAFNVLVNGTFDKALQMHMVRGVTGSQFSDALDESLRPKMSGDEAVVDQFSSFFKNGPNLDKGTEVTLLWRKDGTTEVCMRPPSASADAYSKAQPGLIVASPRLGHALWDLYLSPGSPAPKARTAWLASVPGLSAS